MKVYAAAWRLGVSTDRIRRMIKRGTLRATKPRGAGWQDTRWEVNDNDVRREVKRMRRIYKLAGLG